ncbi:MAG TPA: S8 family serine peptidase [Thermoanaerobaculia bacterium]|nr:S8 family serine peptidase [Thermoanaerobaculia bacterium]
MAARKTPRTRAASTPKPAKPAPAGASRLSSPINEMLLAALDRGDASLQTGRYLMTFKEGATDSGAQAIAASLGMRVADARDFAEQAVVLENVADADAVMFPEIGVALVSRDAAEERGMATIAEATMSESIASVDPEYFVFADSVLDDYLSATEGGVNASDYLRGFMRATETITRDLGTVLLPSPPDMREEAEALNATWGLSACRVPQSTRSGAGIKVAVLDTGMDLGHPDFVSRTFVSATFVGEPVQDLNGHGTHCIGTACGPQSPVATQTRYGIGYRTAIYVGKVLTNSGTSVGGSVLAGMNWAIANRCQVISMSLGSQTNVQPYYTAAGQAALNAGLLMIAAAGNAAKPTGAPANSPTIMAIAALDSSLKPASFSDYGKIELAGPGVSIFSSVPRPALYGYKSGTSQATPHVSGCAALWAESSPNLRGQALWNKLRSAAKPLLYPSTRVGKGLVQAP